MHQPFEISFKLHPNFEFAKVRLNRKSGEFYYFPVYGDLLAQKGNAIQITPSHPDMRLFEDPIHHASWHKDGTLHIKCPKNDQRSQKDGKVIIDKANQPFSEFDERSLLPLISHSIRDENGKAVTVICLLAGNAIIHNLELLPEPYSAFIIKGRKNSHVKCVINSEAPLLFGYIFMQLPFFLPISDDKSPFSMTIPLQEGDLRKAVSHLRGKRVDLLPLRLGDLVPKSKHGQ